MQYAIMLGHVSMLPGFLIPWVAYAQSKAEKHDVTFALTTPSRPREAPRPAPRPTSIPNEIALQILEAACYTDRGEPNRELLKQCALVCKDWSVLAQRLLFRDVVLRTQPAYTSFSNAVDRSTPRGRMLGNAVHTLRVTLDHNQPQSLSEHAFACAVNQCPHLQQLRVAIYGQGAPGEDIIGSPASERMQRAAPSFDDVTLALLCSGPQIRNLHFSNWSDNSTSLVQLLNVWPSLKSLTITGNPPSLPSPVPEPCVCSFEELHMTHQRSPSIDFLKWLTHHSQNSLRVLDFGREPSAEILDHLLVEHHGVLESLSVPTCGSPKAAINGCLGLRSLRIENADAALGLYKSLPETIEHLAVGIHCDTPLQPVLRRVKANTLKTLTLHLWRGAERHPQMNALRIACAVSGVRLQVTKDITVFRSTTNTPSPVIVA
ncbi:hypothetical protein K474DRAFT_695639 [Panus rudis PR-1116 ss-1]|nr:hypothetical protein K474DRAFT_695639 [Panus rudis PR-1116 ss-1]